MLHRHQRVIRLFGEPQHPLAAISDRTGPSLIFRLRWINLVDPVENPASQVEYAAEPDRPEELRSSCASNARLALHHDLFVWVQLVESFRDIAERYKRGSRQPVDLVFVRLPD